MDAYSNFIGKVLDSRYKIEKPVGKGGMAVVFKAMDMLTGRCVAIKMLHKSDAENPQVVRRFINESRAVARFNHNNIVRIYDVSVDGPLKYIVMEYIDGMTLCEYMEYKKPLDWRDAVIYIDQILLALDHAHSKGVIHRDIKPQNIMLLEGGYVKVMDFGIAKLLDATDQTVRTNTAIGTVYYICPEQAENKKIDCRSDIYSLGCMLYEMVTGKLPFTADTPLSVALKQIKETPVPPSQINPKIPLGLEQIINCAMQKNPADRYQSASQMLRHIRQFENDPTIVFVMRKPTPKTPTSDMAIKKTETTSQSTSSYSESAKKPEPIREETIKVSAGGAPVQRAPRREPQRPVPAPKPVAPPLHNTGNQNVPPLKSPKKIRGANGEGHEATSFSTIIFVFVIFLVIAVALMFLIYQLFFSRNVPALPTASAFPTDDILALPDKIAVALTALRS